jgi:hypothetical protein
MSPRRASWLAPRAAVEHVRQQQFRIDVDDLVEQGVRPEGRDSGDEPVDQPGPGRDVLVGRGHGAHGERDPLPGHQIADEGPHVRPAAVQGHA